MSFIDFLYENRRWLLGTILLMLASNAGQTVVIAQFSSHVRDEFGFGHGDFGLLYTIATLCSSAALVWVGRVTDFYRPAVAGIASLLLLAAFSLLMAVSPSVWLLGIALFGLRLFGQGMLPHTALTAIGRWYRLRRGKAIAVATLGYILGEALLPIAIVFSMMFLGWRQMWGLIAMVLVVLFLPAIWSLLKVDRDPQSSWEDAGSSDGRVVHDWTRKQVLADWRFWVLSLGLLASPFIVTGILFHQIHIAEIKSWSGTVIPASLPALALSSAVFSFLAGVTVDRIGAAKAVIPALFLLGTGVAVLSVIESAAFVPIAFVLVGAGGGALGTVNGAIWPELYGVRHLGSIRALAYSGQVFSSSLSPGIMGWLIDRQVSISHQLLGASIYLLFVCIVLLAAVRHFIARYAVSSTLVEKKLKHPE